MQPLYRKLNADCYQGHLSPADVSLLRRMRGILLAIRPRVVRAQNSFPHKIIYTDAATETSVAAAIIFDRAEFMENQTIETCRWMYAGENWMGLFIETNLIYGLELLAVVQTAADTSIELDGKCVTFYVDNNNTISALVRADSKALAISTLARIFWAICIKRSITPWVERVPGKINIADMRGAFCGSSL